MNEGEGLVKLYINPNFLKNLYENEAKRNLKLFTGMLVTLLEHEVLHIIFGHVTLHLPDKSRSIAATDMSVNSNIDKNFLLEGSSHPDGYELERNKSALWYYDRLSDNEVYKGQLLSGNWVKGSSKLSSIGSHNLWKELEEKQLVGEYLKQVVQTAYNLCNRSFGILPSNVLEHLEGLFKRKKAFLDWRTVFRNFIASSQANELAYTIRRRSKRYKTRPGPIVEETLKLAFAIDTSGSISQQQLFLAQNELLHAWRAGAIIDVIEADMTVQRVYPFKGKIPKDVAGRGGTDLNPVLQYVEDDGSYDGLIYFTDFEAGELDHRYNVNTLWLLSNDNMVADMYPCHWGRVVRMLDPEMEVA